MKKTGWVNFVWDLTGNELQAMTTPRQYRLSLVKAAEREQLQGVIEKSFALDPGWNAALRMIDAQVKSSISLPVPTPAATAHLTCREACRLLYRQENGSSSAAVPTTAQKVSPLLVGHRLLKGKLRSKFVS